MDTKEWMAEKIKILEGMISETGWEGINAFNTTETFKDPDGRNLIWYVEVGVTKQDDE